MSKAAGWDPVLLVSQIVAMQAVHYLVLSVLVPPLLAIFAHSPSLQYQGGAANVAMIMDWREMAGRATTRASSATWASWNLVWSGGKQVGVDSAQEAALSSVDPARGWVIAICWMLASAADVYYLYSFVRRPRLVLDFSLTLVLNHLVLTTYYAAQIPSSVFFWLVVSVSTVGTVVFAEQVCVKREMAEGLVVAPTHDGGDSMEMASLVRED